MLYQSELLSQKLHGNPGSIKGLVPSLAFTLSLKNFAIWMECSITTSFHIIFISTPRYHQRRELYLFASQQGNALDEIISAFRILKCLGHSSGAKPAKKKRHKFVLTVQRKYQNKPFQMGC